MDPIKPSGPTGSSPISPQIKVPPSSQQSPSQQPGQQSGPSGQPPPNLPTKEGAIFPSNPASPKPPQASAITSPYPDFKPIPSAPPPSSAKPELPKTPPVANPPSQPATPAAKPPVFKSSIRTMQEDIAAIKKGQPPVGFQVEKELERDIKPPATTPQPKITPPPKPTVEIKLGEPERAKPLPSTKPLGITPPLSAPVIPSAPSKVAPSLNVPPSGGVNKKRLVFIVGGLIIIAFLVWFFALRGPSAPNVALSPTPIYTATPAPTPSSIEHYFSNVDSINIQLGPNFTSRFDNSIDKTVLRSSAGEPVLYIVSNPASGQKYTLSEFLAGLLVSPPAGLISATYDESLYLTAIYKSDGKDGFGFIAKIKEPSAALAALGSWEQTIVQDMKDFFGFDPAKSASTTFIDNTYQGVAIRYKNFPDPNLTIDYAIVRARNGENYLVVANSREHMYTIIDKLK